jgi:crotonobetainyl-CoA:carnitine CoA-transferase CaiB-like acyl-CoA transferase
MNYLVSGVSPTRLGNAHPNIAPYEAFPVADGWIIVAVGNDTQFQRFAALLGLPDRDQWRSNAGRVEDRAALSPAIAERTRGWSRDSLLTALEIESVPAGPINTVADALADPQIAARGMLLDLGEGLRGLRTPIRFSDAGLAPGKRSPRLGEAAVPPPRAGEDTGGSE